jgi:iron complex outermembrane receptor protein
MSNFAPGFSFNMATDRPSIRGIGRQSNFYSFDSPVANYVDGVYTSTVQDAQRRPIFIERTEILRGPQGALSGRGSIGGAINTISKRPSNEFESEIRTYARDYGQYGVEGTVSGPLTDWLRARVNLATYHQDDGYFENVSTGHFEGDQPNNREIADIHFEADFTEDLEGYLKIAWVDYEETRRTGGTEAPFSSGFLGTPSAYGFSTSTLVPNASWGYFPGSNGVSLGGIAQNPVITSGDKYKFASDYESRQELVEPYQNYTAHLNWHAPAMDVKWIGGFQNYTYSQWQDYDGTDITQMTLPGGRVVDPSGVNQYIEGRRWFSNEITLTSTTDGPVQWIVGIFESQEHTDQEPATYTHPGYAELATPAMDLVSFQMLTGQRPFNPSLLRVNIPGQPQQIAANSRNASVYFEDDVDTTSRAIFGQVDYQMNDLWKFTLGLRYNEDNKEVQEEQRIISNSFGNGAGGILAGGFVAAFVPSIAGLGISGPMAVDATPQYDGGALPEGVVRDYGIDPVTGNRVRDLEGTWDATTGSIGVDFTPNNDTLIYFRAAAGYRPGGFNAGFISDQPQVDEETVYSYEFGYKTTLAEQLQLSTSAFYYDFRDNQQILPTLGRCTIPGDLSSCSNVNTFINIPKSEMIGFEAELTYAPIDNLNFYFTYGYLDATVKDGLYQGNGFSNPDDPAAIFPNANQFQMIPGQLDTNYTGLQRYTQDISGNSLANQPKHKFALNGNYTMDFQPGSLSLSASYVWKDDQYSDLFESKAGEIEGFSTLGVRAIWNEADNRYTVIAAVENLTDEDARDGGGLTRLSNGAGGVNGVEYFNTYNLSPPRVWSLEMQYRFGN